MKRGIDIYTNAKVVEIKDGLEVVFEYEGKQLSAMGEICVMAVGRRPDTKDIGLEELGINMNRGFVQVDEYLRTNIPNIYAIGDITGKIQLAHVASAQGLVAAHNATGENKVMHYNIVPACIYTNPEIASVGLTEAQARDKGLDIKIGTFNVNGNGRSMVMQVSDGFAKIITDAKTGEILGGHIMGPRATDMIAEIAVAMKAEATIEELADTIHPHPTVSEIIMEAAHDVEGLCCHKA
ncbi:MAG: FAD-dependent oxidoreductase [Christensenellaceae bacterium]|nr:FAD-dependent oxidoreductase [Christensenellaceae bacterium]